MTTPLPPQPPPLNLSDLIFPSTPSLNTLLHSLRLSTLSLPNRLLSITSDSTFILSISHLYSLPLIANERCGSWYIPPCHKTASAYFKSTDGHTNNWSFSLRRLNLQVLDVVIEYGGAIIVDSTRRGKSMSDALSKTIPIWTCVLNRYFFPDNPHNCHALFTPPNVVSPSEHAQMESRIPAFVTALQSLNLDDITGEGDLKSRLKKPLRPIWVTQDSALPPDDEQKTKHQPRCFDEFYPVVCCTASRRVTGGAEASAGGYIQGAGDDAESWALGLTPSLFWANKEALLRHSEEELPGFIRQLVENAGLDGGSEGSGEATLVKPTEFVYLSDIAHAESYARRRKGKNGDGFDVVVTASPHPSEVLALGFETRYLNLKTAPGKVGSRQLRHELCKLPSFLRFSLSGATAAAAATKLSDDCEKRHPNPIRVLVACPTGGDHGVGVALTILCLLANDDGSMRDYDGLDTTCHSEGLNKQIIKQRLSWISVVLPGANPSRSTLQSVNAFLLG